MRPGTSRRKAFSILTANISYPLMVLLSTMLLPAMIVRFYQGWIQMLVIDLPLFLAYHRSIPVLFSCAKSCVPKLVRTFLYMPFVMALASEFQFATLRP